MSKESTQFKKKDISKETIDIVKININYYSDSEIQRRFNISRDIFDRVIKENNIVKPSMKERIVNVLKEKVSKESLIDYYITQNHSLIDTYTHFDISNANLISLLKEYNIHKDMQLANELAKKTNLEKYGDSNYNNHEQIVKTNLEKYGCENVFQTDAVKETMKKKFIEKYGVDHPMKNKEFAKEVASKHDYNEIFKKVRQTLFRKKRL